MLMFVVRGAFRFLAVKGLLQDYGMQILTALLISLVIVVSTLAWALSIIAQPGGIYWLAAQAPPNIQAQHPLVAISHTTSGSGLDLRPLGDDGGPVALVPVPGPATGPVVADTAGYVFPVVGWCCIVQLHWGAVPGGSDLFAPRGTSVLNMHAGRVISAGWDSVGGNSVFEQGSDGLQYYYAHFNAPPSVRTGQTIEAGVYLGPVGNTGDAAGLPTHLHIGIGPTILLGADKFGGTGGSFNAVGLLQRTFDNSRR